MVLLFFNRYNSITEFQLEFPQKIKANLNQIKGKSDKNTVTYTREVLAKKRPPTLPRAGG
jgi:hypothetical protein